MPYMTDAEAHPQQQRVDPRAVPQPPRQVRRHDQQHAVGEVDHPHHAEDQREAGRHQRVDAAGQHTEDQGLRGASSSAVTPGRLLVQDVLGGRGVRRSDDLQLPVLELASSMSPWDGRPRPSSAARRSCRRCSRAATWRSAPGRARRRPRRRRPAPARRCRSWRRPRSGARRTSSRSRRRTRRCPGARLGAVGEVGQDALRVLLADPLGERRVGRRVGLVEHLRARSPASGRSG